MKKIVLILVFFGCLASRSLQAASRICVLPHSLQGHIARYLIGNYFAQDQTAFLYDLFKEKRSVHAGPINSVKISADGLTVIIGTGARVLIYRFQSKKWSHVHTIPLPSKVVKSIDISADGKTIVIVQADADELSRGAYIYQEQADFWHCKKTITYTNTTIMSVAISADGLTVVIGLDFDNGVRVYTCQGETWRSYEIPSDDPVRSVRINADGKTVVVGGNKALIYRYKQGELRYQWIKDATLNTRYNRYISSLGMSYDSAIIVIGEDSDYAYAKGYSSEIYHYQADTTYRPIHKDLYPDPITALCVSTDGMTVALATGRMLAINYCRAGKWQSVGAVARKDHVTSVGMNADGMTLVAGTAQEAIIVQRAYEDLSPEFIEKIRNNIKNDPQLAFALHEVVKGRALTLDMAVLLKHYLPVNAVQFLERRYNILYEQPKKPSSSSSSTVSKSRCPIQ